MRVTYNIVAILALAALAAAAGRGGGAPNRPPQPRMNVLGDNRGGPQPPNDVPQPPPVPQRGGAPSARGGVPQPQRGGQPPARGGVPQPFPMNPYGPRDGLDSESSEGPSPNQNFASPSQADTPSSLQQSDSVSEEGDKKGKYAFSGPLSPADQSTDYMSYGDVYKNIGALAAARSKRDYDDLREAITQQFRKQNALKGKDKNKWTLPPSTMYTDYSAAVGTGKVTSSGAEFATAAKDTVKDAAKGAWNRFAKKKDDKPK